ncbi:MAG: BlaI/MecI/CopY family transcriptional regulator [Armatimonadota bacterium]
MDPSRSAKERTRCLRFCRLKRVELPIMKVLWEAGVPLTAREVFEELHRRGRWSYLTVRTTVTRMVEAGVLRQERRGRSNLYEPRVERQAVAAACVEEVINEVLGGELGHAVVSVIRHLPLSREAVRLVRRSLSDAPAPAASASALAPGTRRADDELTESPVSSALSA